MTGIKIASRLEPDKLPKKAMRQGYGEGLVEAGRRNPKVAAIAADCFTLLCLNDFAKEHPDRAFNVGIAEQNLIGIAAGMASCGLIPFASSFAPFVTVRSIEQIRDDCAYTGFNVKIAGVYGGIVLGVGGSTHHTTEDFAMLRSIPKMTVLAPADAPETYKATVAAAEYPGPVYIRLGARDPEPVMYQEDFGFTIGKAITLREGSDLTIIATGAMVIPSVWAADALAEEGIKVRLLNMHTIKPIDREAIVKAAKETGRILTVEEHNVLGGMGSAVAEVVVAEVPVPMTIMGLQDLFASIGPTAKLRDKYNLNWQGVVASAKTLLAKK